MVLHYDQIVPTTPAPGITRRILARGGAMMGVEASFEKAQWERLIGIPTNR